MQLFRVGLVIAVILLSQLSGFVPMARALSPNGLVISHVIAGETGFPNAEFVAIYNNGATDIDMTGFCLWSASYATAAIACVQAETNARVFIRAHGYLTIASSTFAANHAYVPDTSYAAANRITVGSDSVYVKDATGNEVDRITWGPNKLATGGTLIRKETASGSNQLVDTDAGDLVDFSALAVLTYPPNTSYDIVTIIDACPNIVDVQLTIPAGYLTDTSGYCQPDACLNIPGLQTSVPDLYDSDGAGQCFEHDECDNLGGVQAVIPPNMTRGMGNVCDWDVLPLELTEVLPNAVGSDTGNEFIEIYNPNGRAVDLALYELKIGINDEKALAFPTGTTIAPGEYRAFTDQQLKFTLLNTSGRVVLVGVDGKVYGDSGMYEKPADGESWASIEGLWRYTNRPTPAAANVPSVIETVDKDITDTPAPCPAGKYRNPLTNRCRNIESDASVLATCDEGQYRNPETGRCRKITTTILTPCKDGQYRSEETNRCRSITTASTQKPCKENQYRSEETNRCRTITATNVPASSFAVQPVKESAMAFVGWWALGGVGILAAGYGVWEWRRELLSGLGGIISRVSGHK